MGEGGDTAKPSFPERLRKAVKGAATKFHNATHEPSWERQRTEKREAVNREGLEILKEALSTFIQGKEGVMRENFGWGYALVKEDTSYGQSTDKDRISLVFDRRDEQSDETRSTFKINLIRDTHPIAPQGDEEHGYDYTFRSITWGITTSRLPKTAVGWQFSLAPTDEIEFYGARAALYEPVSNPPSFLGAHSDEKNKANSPAELKEHFNRIMGTFRYPMGQSVLKPNEEHINSTGNQSASLKGS